MAEGSQKKAEEGSASVDWERGMLTLTSVRDQVHGDEYEALKTSVSQLSTGNTWREKLYSSMITPAEEQPGRTPFHWAAIIGKPAVVKGLISSGLSGINEQEAEYKHTPLHLLSGPLELHWFDDPAESMLSGEDSTFEEMVECMELLADAGGDLNTVDTTGQSVLMRACIWKPDKRMVEAIMKRKPNLKLRDKEGKTAFRHAVENQHYGSAKVLLEYGASLDELLMEGGEQGKGRHNIGGDLHRLLFNHHAPNSYETLKDLIDFLQAAAKAGKTQRRKQCVSINLLGDTCAGKTSLAQSLLRDFPATQKVKDRTIGVDVLKLTLGNRIRLVLYDFAGQTSYRLIHHVYANPAAFNFLFVNAEKLQPHSRPDDYDPKWYEHQIEPWLNLITVKNPEGMFAFVLSKCDVATPEVREQITAQVKRKIRDYEKARVKEVEEWVEFVKTHSNTEGKRTMAAIENLEQALKARLHHVFIWPEVLTVGLKGDGCEESLSRFKSALIAMLSDEEVAQRVEPLQGVPSSWLCLEELIIGKQKERSLSLSLDEVKALAAEAQVPADEIQKCLTYMKATGVILHFDYLRYTSRQLIFHDPKLLLVPLGHLFHHDLATRLSKYFLEDPESVTKMEDEGYIPCRVLKSYMSDVLEEHALVGSGDVNAIIELYSYFNVLHSLSKTRNGVIDRYFLPSLVQREKSAVPDLDVMWPKSVVDQAEFNIFLCLNTTSLPTGFFSRFSVIAAQFAKFKADWKNGFFVEGLKSSILVEESTKKTAKRTTSTLQVTLRVPLAKPEGARVDMVWLYWACTHGLSYYPGVLFTVSSFCVCRNYMFNVVDYFTKSYEELCSIKCPKCNSENVASDYFPAAISDETKACHRRVMRYLLRHFTREDALDFLNELVLLDGVLSRSKHAELKKLVKEEDSVMCILDYLEQKKLFGPGRYTWLCEMLAESDLRIVEDGIRRAIEGTG